MGFISGLTAGALLALTTVTSALTIPETANLSVSGVLEFPLKRAAVGPKSNFSTRGDVSVPVTSFQTYYYFIDIELGSQNATVEVLVDSGSSDLVLGLSNYNPSDSSTAINLHLAGEDWGATYDWYNDTLTYGSLTLPNFQVGYAGSSRGSLSILGIGPKEIEETAKQYDNFPWALAADGYINKPAFSVYLQNELVDEDTLSHNYTNGVVLFGGIDHAKYVGDLISHTQKAGAIYLDDFEFGDGSAYPVNGFVAIDTGTTTAVLPSDLITKFQNVFGPVDENGYIINYDDSWNTDVFVLNFGGQRIEIPYTNFLYSDQPGQWHFTTIDKVAPGGTFILGGIFLRNIYSVFDYSANTILIAQSAKDALDNSDITVIT